MYTILLYTQPIFLCYIVLALVTISNIFFFLNHTRTRMVFINVEKTSNLVLRNIFKRTYIASWWFYGLWHAFQWVLKSDVLCSFFISYLMIQTFCSFHVWLLLLGVYVDNCLFNDTQNFITILLTIFCNLWIENIERFVEAIQELYLTFILQTTRLFYDVKVASYY